MLVVCLCNKTTSWHSYWVYMDMLTASCTEIRVKLKMAEPHLPLDLITPWITCRRQSNWFFHPRPLVQCWTQKRFDEWLLAGRTDGQMGGLLDGSICNFSSLFEWVRIPILLLRGWKPGDINSKHSALIAWNLFDLVKNYQYLCLWISLLCLSTLLRFGTQKLETSKGWAPPKADLRIRVEVHMVYSVGDLMKCKWGGGGQEMRQEREKKIYKRCKYEWLPLWAVGLTLTEDRVLEFSQRDRNLGT